MRSFLVASLTAFPLMFAASASADEFVFNVPIRIENAPGIVEARILCSVTMRSPSGGLTYAVARQTLTIAGGAYRDTLRLAATVPVGSRREDATGWHCNMEPFARVATGLSSPTSDVGDWYEDVAGQSVSSYTLRRIGTVPAR